MADFPVTVDVFRLHVESELEDDALQLLLDAAEAAILASYGASSGVETHDGGQSYIFLRRRAAEITEISETSGSTVTVLDEDDYRLRDDGVSVLRLSTGPTQPVAWSWHSPAWGSPVNVEYTPDDMDAELARVQIALVKADLNYDPGITMEQIGSWMEQKAQANSVSGYAVERAQILATLNPTPPPGFA